uniref:Uncharacterized protein n=1 Tax=Anguilla anguilla TaxID=7936 RepID=A0A0E9UZG4_ANGAN
MESAVARFNLKWLKHHIAYNGCHIKRYIIV